MTICRFSFNQRYFVLYEKHPSSRLSCQLACLSRPQTFWALLYPVEAHKISIRNIPDWDGPNLLILFIIKALEPGPPTPAKMCQDLKGRCPHRSQQ